MPVFPDIAKCGQCVSFVDGKFLFSRDMACICKNQDNSTSKSPLWEPQAIMLALFDVTHTANISDKMATILQCCDTLKRCSDLMHTQASMFLFIFRSAGKELITLAETARVDRFQHLTHILKIILEFIQPFTDWTQRIDIHETSKPIQNLIFRFSDVIFKETTNIVNNLNTLPNMNLNLPCSQSTNLFDDPPPSPVSPTLSLGSLDGSISPTTPTDRKGKNRRNLFRQASIPSLLSKQISSIENREEMEDIQSRQDPMEIVMARVHDSLFDIISAYHQLIYIYKLQMREDSDVTIPTKNDVRKVMMSFPSKYILENYLKESEDRQPQAD